MTTAGPSSTRWTSCGEGACRSAAGPRAEAAYGAIRELWLGCRQVFDDEYLSTGGQLHELVSGRDRFVADLRPLVLEDAGGLVCHPYDVCTAMLLVEAGGVVTDPWGRPLDAPLDNSSPVAWVGYANEALAAHIGPVLAELVDGLPDR